MEDWICKKDSEVPVVYGDSFPMSGTAADENAIGHLKYVLNDVDDIRRSYVMLGFHLSEIQRLLLYERFGYDNMKDFCINNVPVDYSILTRCISVYERFRERVDGGVYVNRLDSKYEGFSFSQLFELLGLQYPEHDLPRLKKYSVVKLRDLKKFCLSRYGKWGYCSDYLNQYEASLNVVDSCDVATEVSESSNCDVATEVSESSNCDVATEKSESDNCDVATEVSESSSCDVATELPESSNCDVADEVSESEKAEKVDLAVLEVLNTRKGAVLRSFVRGFPASRKLNVVMYDKDGKKLYGGTVKADVLCFVGGMLQIRLPEVTCVDSDKK